MKKYFIILSLLFSFKLAYSQSLQVSLTILTPPCTNNGVVQINVTGGTAPYSYNFGTIGSSNTSGTTPTINNNIISGIPPCNLFVSVYDSQMNYDADDIILQAPFQNTISTSPAICPALGEIQVSNVGSGPFLNLLFLNGTLISTSAPFLNLPPAIYWLKTTDANGCFITTDSVNVENITGINVTTVESNVTCQGGTLTASVSGGLAPYNYTWSTGNSSTNIMNGPLGSYIVNVTDAQGCSQEGYGYLASPVNIDDNAVVANTACPFNSGSIQIFPSGGTAPYTCNWNNGYTGNQLNNLNTGYYNGTIIDAAGCVSIIGYNVGIITSINAQLVTVNSDCLSPSGSAQMSISAGIPPYNVQWLTNPPQSGTNLQNVFQGVYPFVITDASGCVQTGSASVGSNDPIYYQTSPSANTCGQNNGAINLYSWGGSSHTYLWSNGATTQNLSNITNGNYSCVISNASGCTKLVGEYVGFNSPFNINSNITQASCIFTADGQILLNITGGTPPYNITWNTGATGSTLNSIPKGDYYASIADANGCVYSYHYYVGYLSTSPCACNLTGSVYFDANNDCAYNNGEINLSNVNVKLTAGTNVSYCVTNATGNYNFLVPAGTYTLEQLPYQYFGAGACSNNPITINANGGTSCVIINNFADTAPAIQDLSTQYINLEPAVVGYGYKQRVLVKNNGTTSVNNANVNNKGNNYAGLISSTFLGSNVAGTGNWNFVNLPTMGPTETFSFDLEYNVLSTTPVNILMLYTDTVQKSSQPWLQDETPWNNVKNLQTVTVASLDPNYKEVSPKGFGTNGDINFSDSILTYTVHFENTGNYFAYNIEIVDSISNKLELNSFEMIYGSHPFNTTIDQNRVLHIKFNNIMLGYNAGWNTGSNTGFAVYSIKLKRNLAIGTKIKNTAYIYFDFNEAVITNTTVNTLVVNAGIEAVSNNEFNLYPNPANNYLIITNQKNSIQGIVQVYDVMGKIWLDKTIAAPVNKVELNNLDQLPNGIYFVNISNVSGEVKSIKFIKSE